ncbi:hypothetical protein GCM10009590_17840 [Brachybacterium alimentarium]
MPIWQTRLPQNTMAAIRARAGAERPRVRSPEKDIRPTCEMAGAGTGCSSAADGEAFMGSIVGTPPEVHMVAATPFTSAPAAAAVGTGSGGGAGQSEVQRNQRETA